MLAVRARHHRRPSAPPPKPNSRIIVDCEVNTGAWTLMHRFNKATDLLGDVMQVGGREEEWCVGWAGRCRVGGWVGGWCRWEAGVAGRRFSGGHFRGMAGYFTMLVLPRLAAYPHFTTMCCPAVLQGRFKDVEDSLVRIYVWLRYSAVRQLTWQRNYNTQVGGVRLLLFLSRYNGVGSSAWWCDVLVVHTTVCCCAALVAGSLFPCRRSEAPFAPPTCTPPHPTHPSPLPAAAYSGPRAGAADPCHCRHVRPHLGLGPGVGSPDADYRGARRQCAGG